LVACFDFLIVDGEPITGYRPEVLFGEGYMRRMVAVAVDHRRVAEAHKPAVTLETAVDRSDV
jgi:hypothetical protein